MVEPRLDKRAMDDETRQCDALFPPNSCEDVSCGGTCFMHDNASMTLTPVRQGGGEVE